MTLAAALATDPALVPGIIYLRLSDFRDANDDTFTEREAELRALAEAEGIDVIDVVTENALNANGKPGNASAHRAERAVMTTTGLITYRTNRPEWEALTLRLQRGEAKVLIVGDDSRIARDERDGRDLIDACAASGASVLTPDDEGQPDWILTDGGDTDERAALLNAIARNRAYSDKISVNVRKGRRRWAGKSYQGGPRIFGYLRPGIDAPGEAAPQHAKVLRVNQAEADAAREAADRLLAGDSLRAVTAWLQATVPTVNGQPWQTRTVRDMLLKPSMIGKMLKGKPPRKGQPDTRPLADAPWPAILVEDTQEQLRALLTDPRRRTNRRGNQPRWLVSLIATCGVCGQPLRIGGAGKGRSPAYVGSVCGHVRRNAPAVDSLVETAVLDWLAAYADSDRFRPVAAEPVDAAPLRKERGKLQRQQHALRGAYDGEAIPPAVQDTLDGQARRIAEIDRALAAASNAPDPLAYWRGGDIAAAWEAAPLGAKRQLVQTLTEAIVIKPAGRTGRNFDPDSVAIRWRPQAA